MFEIYLYKVSITYYLTKLRNITCKCIYLSSTYNSCTVTKECVYFYNLYIVWYLISDSFIIMKITTMWKRWKEDPKNKKKKRMWDSNGIRTEDMEPRANTLYFYLPIDSLISNMCGGIDTKIKTPDGPGVAITRKFLQNGSHLGIKNGQYIWKNSLYSNEFLNPANVYVYIPRSLSLSASSAEI